MRRDKIILGPAAAALVLVALACGSDGAGTTGPPGSPTTSGQTVVVRVGQTVEIPGANRAVTFRAVTEDSRCAIDVVCVWAGNARLALRVEGSGEVGLNTTLAPRVVPVGGVRLQIAALAPEPHAGQPIDPADYVATLEVID